MADGSRGFVAEPPGGAGVSVRGAQGEITRHALQIPFRGLVPPEGRVDCFKERGAGYIIELCQCPHCL